MLILSVVAVIPSYTAMARDACANASFEAKLLELEFQTRGNENIAAAYSGQTPPHKDLISADEYDKVETLYKKKCRKGEALRIPKLLGALWHEQCDFSKSMVSDGGAVVCVKK